MKKVLCVITATLLIILNTFAFDAFATENTESEYIQRTGTSVWVNSWNSGGTRSIKADLQGNLKTDAYYNCFTKYFDISVTVPDSYYASPKDPYFYLKSKTDITEYISSGVLRFWLSVPKDMTLNIELMSNESGVYGRSGIKRSFKASDNVDGYQEVQIPLSEFFGSSAYRNTCDITSVRYVSIGGGSKATADSFLAEGETLKVSFFEIWSATAPTPEETENTPVYYSKSGDYYIKDLFASIDNTCLITAFKDDLRKADYETAVREFDEYATLLELYSVNLLTAGSEDYKVSQISTHVKVYIPLSDQMKNSTLAVATVSDGVLTERDFFIEDDSLAVVTNQLGDILVMNTDTPKYISSTRYYEQTDIKVKDNERISKAIYMKTGMNATKPAVITSEGSNTMPDLKFLCNWMESTDGVLRFWVKVPWEKGTPIHNYKLDLCIKYNNGSTDAYPHTNSQFEIKADGMWHEVRIPANSFDSAVFKAVLANEVYASSYSRFYCRALTVGKTEGTGIYFSKFQFYDIPPKAYVNNGNIERTAFVLDGKKQDYVSDVSVTEINVTDNRFITVAKRITRKETTSDFSGEILLPYSQNISVPQGETYNQISDWFYNDGAELCVFMKNESDSPVSFKVGLYGKVKYNSATTYPKAITNSYITLPANSEWQEIRVKFSDTNISASKIPEFTTTSGIVALEIYTKQNEFLQKTGDSILVSPTLVYSHNIVEGVHTDFSDNYISAGVLKNTFTTDTDSENIEKNVSECDELPFFDKSLILKADKNYQYGNDTVCLFAQEPLFAADFKEWAQNSKAQMRFWVKSDNAVGFSLALSTNDGTIIADVKCEGADGWQEIVLSRSDFSASAAFDNSFKYADTRHVYSYLLANDDTFTSDSQITFGNRLEFFSDIAYSKGDANRDNAVNIKDLVRIKKLSAEQSIDIVCADIDSNGSLNAVDFAYIRKRLLNNSWS